VPDQPVKIDAGGFSTQGRIAPGSAGGRHGGRVIDLSRGLALGVRSMHEVERAIANAIARAAVRAFAPEPVRPLARRLPRHEAGLRRAHREIHQNDRRLRP
jgi:hypothetical protein